MHSNYNTGDKNAVVVTNKLIQDTFCESGSDCTFEFIDASPSIATTDPINSN